MIDLPPRELDAVFGGGDPALDVESLRERSFSWTVGVWRVRSGTEPAVLKLIRLGAAPQPRWPSEPELADPYYWRREPLFYESGLLHEIGGAECEAVLARLDALPHTLAHNDLHPANVHGDGTVVLDWAFCGRAPLGLDPGVLVGDGVADAAIRPEDADGAADAVWEGCAAGLRDSGFGGDLAQVRWAFLRGTSLRLSWLDPERAREDWMRGPWQAAIAMLERWRDAARELASLP